MVYNIKILIVFGCKIDDDDQKLISASIACTLSLKLFSNKSMSCMMTSSCSDLDMI